MLDHYHYVRWGTVNLFNLMNSHDTCPDIYCRFLSNNFSFQKSYRIKWLLSKSTSRAMKKGSMEQHKRKERLTSKATVINAPIKINNYQVSGKVNEKRKL